MKRIKGHPISARVDCSQLDCSMPMARCINKSIEGYSATTKDESIKQIAVYMTTGQHELGVEGNLTEGRKQGMWARNKDIPVCSEDTSNKIVSWFLTRQLFLFFLNR
jgi:hypothetical protein